MRRSLALMAAFILAIAVVSPANAGYLIIRILLEGGDTEDASKQGGPGSSKSGMSPTKQGGNFGPGSPSKPGSGGPGSLSGQRPAGSAKVDPKRCVVAVIPFEEDISKQLPFYPKKPLNSESNPAWRKIHMNYRGEPFITNLFTDGSTIEWYEDLAQSPAARKTKYTEVRDMYAKWQKTKSDPKLLFTTFNEALKVGLVEEALKYADELFAFATDAATDQAAIPPDVAAFAKAYGKIQAGIRSVPSKPNNANLWRLRLGAANVVNRFHYSLIYWEPNDEYELKRRLDILEENYIAFFLVYAARGVALPIPESPLVVVLPNHGKNVSDIAHALDAPSHMVVDGDYSPDHELLVLSPERLDDVGGTFARQTQQMYQSGVPRNKLLAGEGPKISVSGNVEGAKKPEEVAQMQTIALVERMVEDAAMVSAVSREGSLQLMYATHQFPRYVALPQWLTNGAGNFFARPKEPAFITKSNGKQAMHIAMATGYGLPNYMLQRYFKDLIDKNDLNPDRAQLLKNVLTDAYFHGLHDSREMHDPDPAKKDNVAIAIGGAEAQPDPKSSGQGPGGSPGSGRPPGISGGGPGGPGPGGRMQPPGGGPGAGGFGQPGMPGTNPQPKKDEDDIITLQRKKRERLSIKAQATSWALYYYLATDHPKQLQEYLKELSGMPRDLPLEGAALSVFYQTFGLDGSKDSLEKFANGWLSYIHNLGPTGLDIVLHEPKPPAKTTNGPMGPGGPGQNGKP